MNQTSRYRVASIFSWVQLITSIAFACSVFWGYSMYSASFWKFTESMAASIVAVSDVVGRTAQTIDARQSLLDQFSQEIIVTRKLVSDLQTAAENQANVAPQYATGVRAISDTVGRLSDTFQSVGNGMMFSVPTGIRWAGTGTKLVMSRPLEKQGQDLKGHSKNFKELSLALLGVASTIERDGRNLGLSFMDLSKQTNTLLDETERTLGRLKTNDLPRALKNLNETSENLRNVSDQVNIAGSIGQILLIGGLLLAGWCFFNGLGFLLLVNSLNTASKSATNCT